MKKRYLSLAIFALFMYGLFIYEPSVKDAEVKKFLSIKSDHEKVDLEIPNAVNINVDSETGSQINVADQIIINADKDGSEVNVLGIGNEVNKTTTEPIGQAGTEVSISAGNPMGVRAGNVIISDDAVHVDGTGIGEIYELDGQDLYINGVKNHIKVDGECGHVEVNGVAMIVRIKNASSVTVNGVGNRVYLAEELSKDEINKNGVLNFVL